jgi:hypothetical protein
VDKEYDEEGRDFEPSDNEVVEIENLGHHTRVKQWYEVDAEPNECIEQVFAQYSFGKELPKS